MRDQYSGIKVEQAIAPATLSSTTTSAAFNVHDESDSIAIYWTVGAKASGTYSTTNKWDLRITSSDTSSGTFAEVAASDLIKTETAGKVKVIDDNNDVNKVYGTGYVGNKPYIKVEAVKNGSAVNLTLGAVVVRGNLSRRPVD